jgi:hypothetical protein
MTYADYRDMASEIRDLIPLLLHPRLSLISACLQIATRYWRTLSKLRPADCRTRLSSTGARAG